MPNQGKGYAVHINNLFTSLKLLSTLQQYGIGAAGTVRTGHTQREVNDEKRQRNQSSHKPAPEEALEEALEEAEEEAQDEDLDLDLDQDLHSFDDPNVQRQLNLLDTIIQDMYQSRNPKAQGQNPQAQGQNP